MKEVFSISYGVWGIFGVGLLLNIILWLAIWLFFPIDTPAAVLHYSTGIGIDFIGEGQQIIMLPAVGLALLLVNMSLGMMIVKANKRAAWIFWSAIPIIQIILLLAFYLLWRFNS